MTPAAKLRPSPNVPGSMEAAVKMWLKVGNIQKLQQVREEETHLKIQIEIWKSGNQCIKH